MRLKSTEQVSLVGKNDFVTATDEIDSPENDENEDCVDLLGDSPQDIINEVLEFIPEDKDKIEAKRKLSVYQELFVGPMPHPRILREYEDIQPGSTDRILAIHESEVKHRHEMDHKAVDYTARDNLYSIKASSNIIVLLIIVSAILLFFDKKVEGSMFGVAGLLLILKPIFSNILSKKKVVDEE